jgi:hypothetical protein
MSLEWVTDPDPRIIRFTAKDDPPTLEEIERRLQELRTKVGPDWSGLVLNDATAFPAPPAEYMRRIIPAFAQMAKRVGIRRYAVLTSEVVMYGMGRMASYLADPVIELEAFGDEEEARTWLLR